MTDGATGVATGSATDQVTGRAARHIVWDWNGTLFDDFAAVYRAASELFARRGLPEVTPARYRAAYTRPITLFYRRLFGRELAPEEFDGMDEEFHHGYRRALAEVGLTADARDALAAWRSRGGTQSLLSMFRHTELLGLVDRFGLAGEFVRVDGLVGPGGGARTKAGYLVEHLAGLGLTGPNVLLVGDSLDDAEAAASVGAACVLYDGGSHERAALESVGVPVASTLTEAVRWAAKG